MKKAGRENGFTLVELIVVIAILGLIAVVGIHQYGNIKMQQARKMNVSTIKQTYAALSTYEVVNEGVATRFRNLHSLIDIDPGSGSAWTGAAGTFDLSTACASNLPGIYNGSWKKLGAVYNANGAGGSTPDIEKARQDNKGLPCATKLGLYYLTAAEVTLLKDAGISQVLLHNPTTQQAWGPAKRNPVVVTDTGYTADGLQIVNGGPGFRPDMSAFFPTVLTNGSPVAVVNPFEAYSIYQDLGCDLGLSDAIANYSKSDVEGLLAKTKLVCFGIGRGSECVIAETGLGEEPLDQVFDRTYYRNYIAVFALRSGGQGVAGSCRLAGVIDPAGNTWRAANYAATWTNQ